MPPSPHSRRSSPGRELRMETSHRRGRSFEGRLPLKAKDDDLVLFNEMQNHERENFLLHPSEDFDDSISKLKYFPDFKLGVTIPPRGESSDMLNVDAEKNDYDWLLTPPDTPLFPSLDDEPQPLNMSRGRTRTQPISISKPSTIDRAPRANRSSASPQRLSPSPRSSYNAIQSRARPSSAPRCSPPPVRPTTSLRRPSTPTKSSTPTPRSSTPTLRRMSTGSTGPLSSNIRGTSPVKSTRGNSASPKLRGWQTSLPGFSTDVPPNLRTSLPDRPSSRVRGLSPVSGNGRELSSKVRRQSVSPSATRRTSLLHSGGKDVVGSSYSKASVASSGDDDAESVHSVAISVSDSSVVRKHGSFGNSRTIAASKKPSTTQYAGSAPKRSFDSASRQVDQRKTPSNMFRPLLSSVPATTFYVGRANSTHRPLFSRNSSLTTSSNASSELGVSLAPEDSDHEQSELTSKWEDQKGPEIRDEIFLVDKLNGVSEDSGHDTHADNSNSGTTITNVNFELDYSTETTGNTDNNELSFLDAAENSDASRKKLIGTCSICGKDLLIDVNVEGDMCQDCNAVEGLLASGQIGKSPDATWTIDAVDHSKMHIEKETAQPQENNHQVVHIHHEIICDQEAKFCPEVQFPQVTDVSTQEPYNYETDAPDMAGDDSHDIQQLQPTASTGLSANNLLGAGITVLLRSSSGNFPVVQGRAVFASNILCSEPSYARDNMSSCSEPCRESSSASSSIDLGPSKQTYGSILRQLNTKKFEIENVRENSSKCIDMGSSLHKDGAPLFQSRSKKVEVDTLREGSPTSSVDLGSSRQLDNPQLGTKRVEKEEGVGIGSSTHSHSTHLQLGFSRSVEPDTHDVTEAEEDSTSTCRSMDNDAIRRGLSDGENHAYSCEETHLSTSVVSCADKAGIVEDSHSLSAARPLSPTSNECPDISGEVNQNDGDQALCGTTNENIYISEVNITDIQERTGTLNFTFTEGNNMLSDVEYRDDSSDFTRNCSSLVDLEQQNHHKNLEDVSNECIAEETTLDRNGSVEAMPSDKHASTSVTSSTPLQPPDDDPVVMLEATNKPTQKIFTLEEATDTVLFCSSIVHDIAYKAATIGMQKELALSEPLRPAITILGNSVSHQMDLQKGLNKRVRSARKVKRNSPERDSKVPSAGKTGLDVKTGEFEPSSTEISRTVDSMKPPKLESRCNCTVM